MPEYELSYKLYDGEDKDYRTQTIEADTPEAAVASFLHSPPLFTLDQGGSVTFHDWHDHYSEETAAPFTAAEAVAAKDGGWDFYDEGAITPKGDPNKYQIYAQFHVRLIPDDERQITVNRKHFLALLSAACHAKADAGMALGGEWDRSDPGFQSQQWLLDDAIDPFEDLIAASGFTPPDGDEDGADGAEDEDGAEDGAEDEDGAENAEEEDEE